MKRISFRENGFSTLVAERDTAASRLRLGIALLLALVVFSVDTFTSLSSAIAVLYVLVVVLVADATDRRGILLCSSFCVALTLASYFHVHGLHGDIQALLRLVFSIATTAVTTVLTLRRNSDSERLRAQARLLNLTKDAIFLTGTDGKILVWNQGARDLYGWTESQAVGQTFEEVVRPQDMPPWPDIMTELHVSGFRDAEVQTMSRSDRRVDVHSRLRLLRDHGGHPSAVLVSNTDISERNRANEALRQSEQRYRTMFRTLPVAIVESDLRAVAAELEALRSTGVTDLAAYLRNHPEFVARMKDISRVGEVNEAAYHLFGIPEGEQFFSSVSDFLPADDRTFAECLVALDSGEAVFQAETALASQGGQSVHVMVTVGFPPQGAELDRVQTILVDMTERRAFAQALEQTRQELDHAMRVAAIGEVSASIAHEVNQPLTATMSFIQAAIRWIENEDPDLTEATQAIRNAEKATQLAADVVNRVRKLLGKAKPETSELVLDTVIEDALQFSRKDMAAQDIRLQVNLAGNGATIRGDRILLQQVILNVVSNAIHAMEATPAARRSLTVSTRRSGNAMEITVEDTGAGLSDQSQQQLFKAFSTTKQKGMGLGLAVCRSIVMAHNGQITLENRVDHAGALATIRLPLSETAAEDGERARAG